MPITLNGTTGITNDGGYTGDGISFADTTPANTLVTTTGGNVGIGTTTPSSTIGFQKVLEIYDPTASTVQVNGGGTYKAEFGIGSNGGWLGTGTNDPMRFVTNNTERMRIDSNGNLIVGTTTADGIARFYRTTSGDGVVSQNTNNGNHAAFASRRAGTSGFAMYFDCAGNQAGTITHPTTTTTNYGSGSDYRLKDNIQPLNNALNIIGQLKPSKWAWKADGSEDSGFIAHELQELFPAAVTGTKDGVKIVDIKDEEGNVIGQEEKPEYQCVDTSFLVATLTAAIQELKATVDAQAARIAALESAKA